MAAKKRQCINCWYFRDAEMAGNGWCTHPDRQQDSSVRLMVRTRELACRNSWGTDLFVSKDAGGPQREPSDSPSTSRPEHSHSAPVDDEVTSVVTPRLPHSPNPDSTDEDRVVSDRPSPRHDNSREGDDEDDGQNDAARLDQDERARVIARGSADAIASARARLIDRRRQRGTSNDQLDSEPDDPAPDPSKADPAENSGHTVPDERVVSQQERLAHRFTRQKASANQPEQQHEPVPRAEVEEGQRQHPGSRDRYDTVPVIDPNFDLPGWRRGEDQAISAQDGSETPSPAVTGDDDQPPADTVGASTADAVIETGEDDTPANASLRTYEHVLNRARRIREAKSQARPHPHSFPFHESVPERAEDTFGMQAQQTGADLQETASRPELPPLLDEQVDQPLHIAAIDHDNPASPDNGAQPAPAQGDRRQSWLARFGINRNVDNDDDLHYRRDDIDAGDHERLDDWAGQDYSLLQEEEAVAASAGRDRSDPSHEWYPDSNHGAVAPLHAQETVLESHSVRSYYSELDDNLDESRYARRPGNPREFDGAYSTRGELPDIEPLFAESHVSGAYQTTQDDAYGASNRAYKAPDATRAEPESPPIARRWIDDPAPSPRDSFFRAHRFQERNEQHPAPQAVELNDDMDEYNLADGDMSGYGLPDLDAGSFDLRDVIERGGEVLDMRIDIAPDIPRACRTCRSFRAADGGARGWCTNEWAFTHRRMVNEDDIACETTIGSWWLPDDRYWLPEDIDARADATPRMDALMARGTTSPKRKIAGE